MDSLSEPVNVVYSKNEENLASRALQYSERLLTSIQAAKNHIRQVYRVQIIPRARGGELEIQEKAFNLILARLESLKTTIQVNQYLPRMFFRHRLAIDGSYDAQNQKTYEQLRDFVTKYSVNEGSWASLVHVEVETFKKYDAADFKRYIKIARTILSNGNSSAGTVDSCSPDCADLKSGHKTCNETNGISLKNDLTSQNGNTNTAKISRLKPREAKKEIALLRPLGQAMNGTPHKHSCGEENTCSKSTKEKPRLKKFFFYNNKKNSEKVAE